MWLIDKIYLSKNYTYIWLGKTTDNLSSSIISTYDANRMQNSTLKIPWFHTPASHFSQNGHDTMGDISKNKLAMTDSFRIYGDILLPFYCLQYWPSTISRKILLRATCRIHCMHPKTRFPVVVKEWEDILSWKNIYINTNLNKFIQECIIMAMPTLYSPFLNENLQK